MKGTAPGGARRIEPREPTVRAHPVHAGARLDEAVDRHRGQALAFAVVDEAMAVEPAEPVDRAEPQKAARVLYDAEDTIVAETIRRGIRARRQAFGERMRSRERHHRRARHHGEPLHRASPNRMSGAHLLPMAAFRVSVCFGAAGCPDGAMCGRWPAFAERGPDRADCRSAIADPRLTDRRLLSGDRQNDDCRLGRTRGGCCRARRGEGGGRRGVPARRSSMDGSE